MNKILPIILTIVASSLFFSCESNNYEKSTINGEWTTIERYIKFDKDFSTENFNLHKSFNELFAVDNKSYIIKRTFSETEENKGAIETIAINRTTGHEDRNRSGIFQIKGDSLFIDDEKFEQTTSYYRLEKRYLTTYTTLKKKDLDYLYRELGGDPNLIPDDAVGILEMRERK